MDGFSALMDKITNERESTMIIRDIADCSRNRVIDGSLLAELLHPDKVAVHRGSAAALPTRSSRPENRPSPTS